ncbi:MAG TPA: hypothetical protein VGR80_13855 [Steroidobacteraceae bacterium]|nr:hypothetical protein [Gammaproteobacteria bacterium]HEV2287124.1 hypothetical protein [Steroidobacteraceae bacterium]
MRQIIRLFVEIALLKRGPQDLPASRTLLALTVCAYAALTALVSGLLPRGGASPLPLAVEVAFTLVWYAAVLKVLGRRERFLQTATGIFGVQTLLMQPLLVSVWLMRRYEHDATWQLPVAAAGLAVVIWVVAANSHVVKAALEWSSAASVALVILQIVSGQLLLFTLFPPTPV